MGKPSQKSIYVTPDSISNQSLIYSREGNLNDPYDNIQDALVRAYELAAPFRAAQLTIYLLAGNSSYHYILNDRDYSLYNASNIDSGNTQLSLNITTYQCS